MEKLLWLLSFVGRKLGSGWWGAAVETTLVSSAFESQQGKPERGREMTSASWILCKVRLKGCNLILTQSRLTSAAATNLLGSQELPVFVNYPQVPHSSVVTEQNSSTVGLFCCPYLFLCFLMLAVLFAVASFE